MTATPDVGWVRIESTDPPLSVTCRLAEDRPDVTSGYGGWEEVARPWRPPITTWRAPTSLHMALPVLLDGWAEGVSVETDIARLTQMSTPTASDGATPRVHIYTTGSAIPFTGRTWVVGELTWGEALMNRAGNRVRRQVTLTLYEYVDDVYLTEKSAAKRRRQKVKVPKKKAGAAAKRVKAKKGRAVAKRATRAATAEADAGEDLLSIAARELGDADRWVEIAKLNGMRDPRAISIGQVIRLP